LSYSLPQVSRYYYFDEVFFKNNYKQKYVYVFFFPYLLVVTILGIWDVTCDIYQ